MDLVDCIDKRCSEILKNIKPDSHPIIKSFLELNENQEMFQKVISEPSIENANALDLAFKLFFYEIRLIKYMTNLIKHYAMDIVKKYRRHFKSHLYIIDRDTQSDESFSLAEYFAVDHASDPARLYEYNCSDFLECIGNSKLKDAIKGLSRKQIKVLELFYIRGLDNQSVAMYFNETNQNISKMHNRTLAKLYKRLVCDVEA